jgi:hypothetical protein
VKNNPVAYIDPTGHWAERNELGGWGSCYDTFSCTELNRWGVSGGECGDDCAFVFNADGMAEEYSMSEQDAEIEKGLNVVWTGASIAAGTVGADALFDGAELAYCTATANAACAAMAGAALLAPGVSSAVMRNGGDAVVRYVGDAVGAFCSFSEDTLVSTEDGLVPISEVELDDYVLAYNEETGEIGYYPVVAIWAHEDPVIVYLTIDGETIVTTPEHPFYTAEGEWVPAAGLQLGDEIRTAEWGSGTVERVRFSLRPQMMYNFTVAEAHTYFIAERQWLVHNACISHVFSGRNAMLNHMIEQGVEGADGFQAIVGGATHNTINNPAVLDLIRETFGSTRNWTKVYQDGYDALGNPVSLHYFLDTKTGQVWGGGIVEDWSNMD